MRLKNKGNKPILVGLEGAFNEYLKGQNGLMLMEKIRGNEWKPVDDEFSVEPVQEVIFILLLMLIFKM